MAYSTLTREEIDKLLKKAELEDMVTVYNSAIEINTNLRDPELPLPGEDYGYRVLSLIIETALTNLPESGSKEYRPEFND